VWSIDLTSNAGVIILACADGSVRYMVDKNAAAGSGKN
jgi:hypothetical protein